MPTINQLVRKPRKTPKVKSKVRDLDQSPQRRGVCLSRRSSHGLSASFAIAEGRVIDFEEVPIGCHRAMCAKERRVEVHVVDAPLAGSTDEAGSPFAPLNAAEREAAEHTS